MVEVKEKNYSEINYGKEVILKNAEMNLSYTLKEARDLLERMPCFNGVPREELLDAARSLVQEVYINLGSNQIYTDEEQELRAKYAMSCVKIFKRVGADLHVDYNRLKEQKERIESLLIEYEDNLAWGNFFFDRDPQIGSK